MQAARPSSGMSPLRASEWIVAEFSSSDLNRFSRIGVSQSTLSLAGVRRVTHDEAIEACGITYKSEHLEGMPSRIPTLPPVG